MWNVEPRKKQFAKGYGLLNWLDSLNQLMKGQYLSSGPSDIR